MMSDFVVSKCMLLLSILFKSQPGCMPLNVTSQRMDGIPDAVCYTSPEILPPALFT